MITLAQNFNEIIKIKMLWYEDLASIEYVKES